MGRIQLVRGLPGSGKSTFSKELFKDYLILEPDMLCIDDGVYDWNLVKERRNKTMMKVWIDTLMKMGVDIVIPSVMPTDQNGSLLGSVLKAANESNVHVYIWDCKGTWKNRHDVPAGTLVGMRNAFVPGEAIVRKWKDSFPSMEIEYGVMDGVVKVTPGKEGEMGAE